MELRELKLLPRWRMLWITMWSEVEQQITTVNLRTTHVIISFSSGVTHNIPLLREIITHPRFISGDISTNFLPEVYPDGFKGHQLDTEGRRELLASAAALYVTSQLRSQKILGNLRWATPVQFSPLSLFSFSHRLKRNRRNPFFVWTLRNLLPVFPVQFIYEAPIHNKSQKHWQTI